MRSLHIISIEKFLPHVVEISEAVNPGQNRYIAVNLSGRTAYGIPDELNCNLRPGPFQLDNRVQMDIDWCDALFVHWLSPEVCEAILAAGPRVVVVWCGLGGDFYYLSPNFRDRQFLPHTLRRRFRSPVERSIRSLKANSGFAAVRKALGVHRAPNKLKAAASRIDIFCASETNLEINSTLPDFRARQVAGFGYYTLEQAIGPGASAISGGDLLIGNSATWTNNHFDIFEQLRGLDLDSRCLVLPLSYGDRRCADAVEEAAVRQFGKDRVVILRDWMPIEKYNAILGRCGIVLMNHVRSQALGNICSMLYRGAKVYLRPENPFFHWLRDVGAVFREIPRGRLDEGLFAPLTPEERVRNRDVMRMFWRRDAVRERAGGLFATVAEEVARRRCDAAQPIQRASQ